MVLGVSIPYVIIKHTLPSYLMSKYKELLSDVNKFLYDYAIHLSLEYEELGHNPDIRFMGLIESNYEDLKNYFKILKSELGKYNSNFIKTLGIKKIYLVRDLDVFNHDLDYFISFQNYCSDTQGFILIDIHDFRRKFEDIYKVFLHHEIFHFILEKYGNRLNLELWKGLNSEFDKLGGFKYLLDKSFEYKSFAENGFVSNYATLGLVEDLSETFAYMVIGKYREKLITKAKKDEILKYKIQFINRLVSDLRIFIK
jgi:hypothetical protein